MGFVSTNPVSAGDYVLATQYDVVFDNAVFLHDNILQLNGILGDIVGEVAPAKVSALEFDSTKAKTVDMSDSTATLTVVGGAAVGGASGSGAVEYHGDTAAGGRAATDSLSFIMRGGDDRFGFYEQDGTFIAGVDTSGFVGALSTLTNTTLKRDVQNSFLLVTGGTTTSGLDRDSYFQAYGKDAGASAAIVLNLAGGGTTTPALQIQKTTGAAVQKMFDLSATGIGAFYNPADNTDKIVIDPDGTTSMIGFNINGTEEARLQTTTAICSLSALGELYLTADGRVRITADDNASSGGAYRWYFGTDGHTAWPDGGAKVNGSVGEMWWDDFNKRFIIHDGTDYRAITAAII